MLLQTLSAFSPISHYNNFNTKSTTFQIQTQTDSNYSPLNTNLVGGAGNYGSSSVNKNNGNGVILLHQGQYNNLRSGFGSNNTTLHGNVNILLGGAMLSVVVTILCIACYCCHRNIKKRTESAYRQRWLENDDNMEIYSVEQCYESSGLFMSSSDHIPTLSHEPPPPYDAVILNEIANRSSPPPGYRSTNSINNTNEFLAVIPIRKEYNYDDEYPRQNNNRILRTSQSVCSLERAHNHRMQIDEIISNDTSSSSDQNSYYTNNNNNYNTVNRQQFILKANNNNSDSRTLYSKLKSNSSSNDSGLDVLANTIQEQEQENDFSLSEYNSDISPVSLSVPSTSSYHRQNHNENENNNQIENRSEENTDNNLMDLLINEEENDTNNNNNMHNFSIELNSSENNNNCVNESNNNNNSNVNLESFNENGIVRLDMSQIIDTTGLPTYEAALKLESSGYV